MTNEEALVGFQNLYNEIDKDNHLFVGTINPEWIQLAIEALENNDKLAEDLQNCLEMYKKKKAEVEALKQNQWIPCDKELPLYMQRVLVTFHNEQTGEDLIRTSYCYMQIDGFFSDTPLGYKAVAWMPLPKPYEGRTE